MKLVRTEDAIGQVLCHDITQIIRGVTKDAVFRKGHVVTEEDIPVLLSVGKEHLYIWEKEEHMLHENEAAEILYEICRGEHMHGTEVKDGKRFIEISLLVKGRNMVFTIGNSFNGELKRIGNRYISLKRGRFHGIGLKHVDSIVEKYNGQIVREVKGRFFETCVVLPIL